MKHASVAPAPTRGGREVHGRTSGSDGGDTGKSRPAWLTPQIQFLGTFIGVILIGWGLLSLPSAQAELQPGTWLDHLFTATSAVSTSGLTTLSVSKDYSFFGQLVILGLFQLGGLGYLAFAALIGLPGKSLSDSNAKALRSGSYLPEKVSVREFLRVSLRFTLLAELLGSIALTIAFKQHDMSWADAAWWGVYHAISAFCTAGFGLDPDSLQPFADDPFIMLVILGLMLMGAIGFMVLVAGKEFFFGPAKRFDHMTKAVLFCFVAFLLIATGLIWSTSEVVGETSYPLLNAVFLSMTSLTGAGFASVDTGALGLGVLIAIVVPMCAGGAPTGTSGGVKLSNLSVAFAAVWSQARGREDVHLDGVALKQDKVHKALGTITLYAGLLAIAIAWAFYLEADRFKFEALAFEVVSAFGTVGLSRGITADLATNTKALLVGVMFVGRVGALTLIMGLLKSASKPVD